MFFIWANRLFSPLLIPISIIQIEKSLDGVLENSNPGLQDVRPDDGHPYILKMGYPRLLFRLFSSFQTRITILTTNKCEKCPSSIWRLHSNPQPSEDESPPITTRPQLPPIRPNNYVSPFLKREPFHNKSFSSFIPTRP